MGVLDLDSSETESAKQGGGLRTCCDKGDGTTTSTTVRAWDDQEDAAYPSHTLAGMQAASTWDPVVTLRCCG